MALCVIMQRNYQMLVIRKIDSVTSHSVLKHRNQIKSEENDNEIKTKAENW